MKIRSSERWQQIDLLFAGALPLSPEERTEYLDRSCGPDAELRSEVERLLVASDAAGDFLEALDAMAAAKLLEASSAAGESIGRYKIVRKIGSGGMGVVYLAEDASLKRRVAVKLLPPWLHASSRANRRLLEEARAASAIDHPNIATVHEIGETADGRLFITMSYYEGDTLRDRIARETALSVDSAVNIALQTATGLAAAHRKGIIHRDIKPENLLITIDGIVKIVDFGLAGIEELAGTQGGPPAGTVAYMSPEQTLGIKLDSRTDLWSMGIVLYEMLAGERPFTGGTQDAIILSTRSESLRMNERMTREVPAALRGIVNRCLEKNPVSRYQSADEIISDLIAVRDTAIPERKQAGLPYRSPSGGRRALVLGAAALAMLAIIGTAAAWRNARARESDRAASPGASPSSAERTSVRSSLAVLPFADMSPNSDHEYLSDGITEELIHALAGVERLRVVARSSAFQFKDKQIDVREAGAKLGVAHILEGSVRSSEGRLRIVVRLADAKQGFEVWSQVFDRTDKDVLAIQSDIARAVIAALRVQLGPGEQAAFSRESDPDAYALYLKGQHLFNQRTDLGQAIRYFRASIAIDSTFARAWNGLGRTWLVMPVYTAVTLPQALDSAAAAVGKALSLDPDLADAHATRGSMMADEWRWAESEPHFIRAIEINGGDATAHQWYGEMLVRTGRLTEAIEQLKVAEQLDPLASVIPTNLGWAYLSAGREEEALATFRAAIDFNPRHVQGHVGVGNVLLERRRFSEAITALEKAVELANGQRSTRAHLARGYAIAGRRSDAMRIFAELKGDVERGGGSPWGVALVAMSLGLEDEALRWLELGYERRELGIGYLKTSHAFKALRSDERFTGLLKRMGL